MRIEYVICLNHLYQYLFASISRTREEVTMFKATISTLILTLLAVAVLPSVVLGQVVGPDYWWVQDNDGTMPSKSFRGICALSETDVWVVGEWGAVYHRQSQIPVHQHPAWLKNENFPQGYTDYHFNDICFADASHGWIVGEKKQTIDPVPDPTSYSGVIFYTANGGTSWSDQTPNIWPTFPIPTSFRKVKMVWKQLTQHYVGYIACGNGAMLKTENDGVSWSHTPTDPWSDPDNVSNWYNGLWVDPSDPDFENVWVASDAFGIIAKTDDGGNTWTSYQPIAFNQSYSFPAPPRNYPLVEQNWHFLMLISVLL